MDEAREKARELVASLQPFAARGIPIVGLEPSCLFTLRDEARITEFEGSRESWRPRTLPVL